MSNNIPNFNNILDHAKLAEEYLDASALNEEQKTAVIKIARNTKLMYLVYQQI